jgi:DNA invertase Pin-like site-specific DNA recombinase
MPIKDSEYSGSFIFSYHYTKIFKRRYMPMDEKLINEVKQLLRKGMSYKDIAIEMELSESVIRRIVKNLRAERQEREAHDAAT